MKINDIVVYLEQKFPYEIAEDFDQPRIGFILGNTNTKLSGVLLTLDLTIAVANEALSKQCNLIIAHHPFIFEPLYKITNDTEKGNIINFMIKNNLSLYVMHTNFDVGINGINDTLGKMLSINCPHYECGLKGKFLRAGNISPKSLKDVAELVKATFGYKAVKVFGDENKTVNTLGIVGGSGAHVEDILVAINEKCDCYITGEIKHSNALLSLYHNLSLIEVPHGIEKFGLISLKKILTDEFNINIEICDFNTDSSYII